MSQVNFDSIILASTDVPLLHFRAKYFITVVKFLVISEIMLKINYADLLSIYETSFLPRTRYFDAVNGFARSGVQRDDV